MNFIGLADVSRSASCLNSDGHRWKYALVEQSVGRPFLRMKSVVGDGMLGGKVESALLSGRPV